MKSRILIFVTLILITHMAIAQTSNVITKMYKHPDSDYNEISEFSDKENIGAYTSMDIVAGTYQWQVRVITPSGITVPHIMTPNPPLITEGGSYWWWWNFRDDSFDEIGQYTTEFLININNSGFKVYSSIKFSLFKSNCPTKGAFIPANTVVCKDQPIMLTLNIDDGVAPFHAIINARNIVTNEVTGIAGDFNFQLGSNSIIINPGDQNYLPIGEYTLSATVQSSNGFDVIFTCSPALQLTNQLRIVEGFKITCSSNPDNGTANGKVTIETSSSYLYGIVWTGKTSGFNQQSGSLLTVGNLPTGSYDFIVTNTNGCSNSCSIYIDKDSGNGGCTHPDYSELMKLYNSTGGPNWKRNGTVSEPNSTISGWNKDCDICNWYGVRCNANNRIVCIDLDGIDNCKWDFNSGNNNMIGTIPALSFEEVEFFNLSNNGLMGSLSDLNLPKVISLNITDSKLNGEIPNYSLENLEEIRLQYNQLTGNIPPFNLSNLKLLDIGGNRLTGTIPTLNLRNLKVLSLGTNELSGSIPIFNFPRMETLYLQNNTFSGTIPPLDMPLLKLLWLNNNDLFGCIPSIFQQNCGILTDIQLSGNLQLFPSWEDFCNNNAGICDDTATCPNKITFSFQDTICQDIGFNVYILTEGGSLPYLIDWYLNDTLGNSLLFTDSIKFTRDTSYFSMMNASTIFGSATTFSLIPKIRKISVSNFENNCDDVMISGMKRISIKNCNIFISNDKFDVLQAAPLDLQYQCYRDSFKFVQYPEQYRFSICDRFTLFYFINLKKDIDFIARVLVKKDGQVFQSINYQSINNPIIGKGGYVWWLCNFLQLDNPGSYQLEFYVIDVDINQDYLVNSVQVIIDDITEYRILKSLFNQTGGQDWSSKGTKNDPGSIQNGWNKDCDYCNWYGVICDENKRVVSINLQGNNLSGTLPDLSGLEKLQVLKFDNNLLIGSIPNFNLPNLTEIYLNANKLNGIIPSFKACPNLTKVLAHNNELMGKIPEFELQKLIELDLAFNKFSGQLPLLLNCPNIVQLLLNDNKLNGRIPQNYGLFKSLNILLLRNNNLEGCIHQDLKLLCNRLLIGDIIKNNPNLNTDSWDDFCNNNTGLCCFKPLIPSFAISGLINEVNMVELKNYGSYPEKSFWKITNVKNNQLKELVISIDGVLTYSFDKHFFGEVEITIEACGLDCNECDNFVVKITDTYVPYIFPTNVISPDGDGIDEVLKFNDDVEIFDSELTVFNRWGDVIYRKKQYSNDWDANGYPGGIYFYALKVKDVIFKSTLTIIK
jgi:hypothetical protein